MDAAAAACWWGKWAGALYVLYFDHISFLFIFSLSPGRERRKRQTKVQIEIREKERRIENKVGFESIQRYRIKQSNTQATEATTLSLSPFSFCFPSLHLSPYLSVTAAQAAEKNWQAQPKPRSPLQHFIQIKKLRRNINRIKSYLRPVALASYGSKTSAMLHLI